MKKVIFMSLMTLFIALSFNSCRDTNEKDERTETEKVIDEMEADGADVEVSRDGDKIKMETDDKEVKIKEDDGDVKVKVKTENDDN